MTINTIEAERLLLNSLREAARNTLGPDAGEAEVEAEALRAYEGSPRPEHVAETAEQRQRREHNTRMARENYRRWKL